MALPKPNCSSLFGEEPDDDSFWLKLMAECLENPVTKLPAGRRLLVLGDNEAEKTLLVTKLQGGGATEVNFTKGNGLEYRCLSVKDEYCDSHTKLGVWILDGDPFYKPLLKYALDASSLADTTVLLVASMTKPWDIIDTIDTWTEILRDHIEGLADLPPSDLELAKGRVLERFREYIEPGLSIYGSLAADTTRELDVNLGVETIVVITRTEYMRELQTEFGYEEEHFDFIQLRLREFCLSHGAALFYVSVKEDKNCDLLLKYVLHRAYSFPFRLPGVLVERDSILVPAGWDTKNKVRFLTETLPTIASQTPYGEVAFKPARLSDTKRAAAEIVAQHNQEFLAEMQAALERQASEERTPESSKEASSSMTATVVQRNVARRMTRAQPGRSSPQKKMEAAKLVSGEGDNTLSNFFHSLLNRRTSAPVDRPVGFTGTRTMTPKSNQSEHHLTRNISTTENTSVRRHLLHGISEQQPNSSSNVTNDYSRRSSEESGSENEESSESCGSRSQSTAQASLDKDNEETHQLPEYFLSSPGGVGHCCADCSFQKDSGSSSSFDLEDEFGLPLDRVRSSFNPPLKQLLLEKHEGKESPKDVVLLPNGGKIANGDDAGSLKNGNAAEFERNSAISSPGLVRPGGSVMSSSTSMPFQNE